MRTYAVDGRYRAALEAAINDAVGRIRQDIDRREKGLEPLIPDFMIAEQPKPDAIVAIDSVVVVANRSMSVGTAIERARESARTRRRKRA